MGFPLIPHYTTKYLNGQKAFLPYFSEDGSLDPIDLHVHPSECPQSLIPFSDCKADLLFLAGEEDHNYRSVEHVRYAEHLMRQSGKTNYEAFCAPGTGHVCGAPNSPGVYVDRHPAAPAGQMVYMGGDKRPDLHNRGQTEFWTRAVDFFKRKL